MIAGNNREDDGEIGQPLHHIIGPCVIALAASSANVPRSRH